MTRLSVSAGASAVMNIDLNDYCQFCGAIIPVTKMINIRKYCSRKCCEADEYRLRKEAILEARADRVCEWCREPICRYSWAGALLQRGLRASDGARQAARAPQTEPKASAQAVRMVRMLNPEAEKRPAEILRASLQQTVKTGRA